MGLYLYRGDKSSCRCLWTKGWNKEEREPGKGLLWSHLEAKNGADWWVPQNAVHYFQGAWYLIKVYVQNSFFLQRTHSRSYYRCLTLLLFELFKLAFFMHVLLLIDEKANCSIWYFHSQIVRCVSLFLHYISDDCNIGFRDLLGIWLGCNNGAWSQ